MKGPAPAPPFPADRRGLLPEQRLLLRRGPDAGHQDRHGGPGPRARQPATDAAAAPPQCPASPHLRAAQHRLQQASEVGCLGPWRALGGARGEPPALTAPPPCLPLLGRPSRVKQNSESERRSPSSEDDRDERESRAEIQNAEDYNEIFQPKNSISEALPSPPFPSPPSPTIPLWDAEADGPFQDGVHVAAPPLSLISHPHLGLALSPGPLGPSRSPAAPRCSACQGPGHEEGQA